VSPIDRIKTFADDLVAIRRDFHAHPELGFEEVRTSGIVAAELARYGIAVHRGIGGTGVVGVLEGRTGSGRHRPARRHGRPADRGGDQPALPLDGAGQDARLRP
jgi:hypothetical protein